MPIPELFAVFVRPLNRLQLHYMITGAVAAIVYGEPRITHGLGLVLQLHAKDADRFVRAFPDSEFYVPPLEVVRREALRPAFGHFKLVHLESALKADVYLAGDDPVQSWGLSRRWSEPMGDESVWLAPIEYVILLKLRYYRDGGSERHLRDIAQILRVSGPRIQRADLAKLIAESRLEPEWSQVPGSSGF